MKTNGVAKGRQGSVMHKPFTPCINMTLRQCIDRVGLNKTASCNVLRSHPIVGRTG
jgi:hypothetical protein